ncbi:hypothetical protein [Hydrocarboniphaga sp.]|uniref:hypothetical protein n=1 Tax=Hydrocarboniphaga sp. TaxID=2033016 RepID=UPI00262D3040|nr:hypothetical protein [Hydrocarboniphaga sp.]
MKQLHEVPYLCRVIEIVNVGSKESLVFGDALQGSNGRVVKQCLLWLFREELRRNIFN